MNVSTISTLRPDPHKRAYQVLRMKGASVAAARITWEPLFFLICEHVKDLLFHGDEPQRRVEDQLRNVVAIFLYLG